MSIEERLNQLTDKFSYNDFIDLLKEIDLKPNISLREQQLLFSIMEMVNDNYLIDGVPGTLGHMLLEQKLMNKEKITPTILFFFFEEQLKKIGLLRCQITFYGGNYDMCHTADQKDGIDVNLKKFDRYEDADTYNYEIMYSALHEIVHAYQIESSKFSSNELEVLTAINSENANNFIRNFMNNSTESNIRIHNSLVIENEAINNARLYIIQIAQQNPKCFNEQLLSGKIEEYKRYLDMQHETYSKYEAFAQLILYTEQLLKYRNQLTDTVKQLLEKIMEVNSECEKKDNTIHSIDYNIFLRQYFSFEGEKLVTSNEPPREIPKSKVTNKK